MVINNLKHKILICTGIFWPDIGGPASYAKTLAKKLKESGMDVCVLSYSSKFSHKGDNELGFRVSRVWNKWPKGFKHLIYFWRVWRLSKQYDVVYALNAVSAGYFAMLSAKMRKKKFFVKIVGDYAWETAMNKSKTHLLINDFQKSKRTGWIGMLHGIQKRVCLNSDNVIVPSEYLAGIVKGWQVPEEKIKVIYNGVDFVPSELIKEEARKLIGIPGNIILSVGRLVPWKGFKMLIKIMPQLLQINQFFRVIIVGDGPDQKALASMVRNLGLERKVYLVGKKDKKELATYMAASDIFVLNTGYEGFSHQLIEAMAAGVPIITTAVGGNKEIIRQGENGFMIKYNDEFNLIEAIKSLWSIKEMSERFIQDGLKTARKYSAEKMYNETIELLSK